MTEESKWQPVVEITKRSFKTNAELEAYNRELQKRIREKVRTGYRTSTSAEDSATASAEEHASSIGPSMRIALSAVEELKKRRGFVEAQTLIAQAHESGADPEALGDRICDIIDQKLGIDTRAEKP